MADKELGILIRAKGAAQASAAVKGVDSSFNSLTHRAGVFATSLKTNVSGALTTFGGRLKQAAVGIVAFAGIGGVLGLSGALEQGISRAQNWGLQIEKLQGITHDSAESLSGLLAVTEKYGLANERLSQIAGFTEKALGAIALKAKGAAKFQHDYGFAITDSTGHVKDFSTLLLSFADYWKNGAEIPSLKAAAAAKLFGRGYADLVPILNLGAKGIQDAEDEAKALGLTLTQDNVAALAKAREATRQWSDAIGGLELQIGLALLPALTDLAHAATAFVSGHRGDIVTFFTNAVAAGRQAVAVIGDLAGKVNAFWSSIPQGVRDLLVKGIVADRAISFFFGISPIKIVASLATTAIEGLLGGVAKAVGSGIVGAGLGKLFVQPVFVTNPGFGGVGGVGGEVAGAAGVGAVAVAVSALAIPVAIGVANLLKNAAGITDAQQQYLNTHGQFGNRSLGNPTYAGYAGAPIGQPSTANQREDRGILVATRDHGWEADDKSLIGSLGRLSGVMTKADWLKKLQASWLKAGQTMHDKIKAALAGIGGPNSKAAAAFLGSHLGNAGFGAGGYDQAVAAIAGLKNLHTTDPTVVRAIQQLEARLPRLKITKADLEAAEKEAQSADPKNKKLDELNRILADLRAHGDRTTARKVQGVIDAVRHQKTTVNLKTSASTFVKIGVGGITKAQTVIRVYGTGGATGKYLA